METIHLDTNFLIALVEGDTSSSQRLERWIREGTLLSVSAVVWTEFLTGPLSKQQLAHIETLIDEVIPFDKEHARVAATLYNKAGRGRTLRMDAMIAATAIVSKAPLATENISDMKPFVKEGLKLAK